MNVVITGTSQGLGSELAKQLRPLANTLVTINRRKTSSENEVLADLGARADVVFATNELMAKFSEPTEILFVQNAAVYGDDETINDLTPEITGTILYTNVFGQLTIVESLLKAGHRVRLVAVSSGMGSIALAPEPYHYAYSASKAALNLSVRLLKRQHEALDYVLIDPGWMRTQMGGEGATVDPADTARFIVGTIQDKSKWNNPSGFLDAPTGEVKPW